MDYKNIIFEIKEKIARLTINRPESLNSLDLDTISEMEECLKQLRDSRVLVISGRGRAFCTGADLSYLKTILGDPLKISYFLHKWKEVFWKIENLPIPVIGQVHGFALAGGLELLLVCDIVIASDDAKIGDQHANFGLIPGGGGSQRLPRKIPINMAKELLLTGRWLSSKEAFEIGLVNKVVKREDLESEVDRLAKDLSEKSPVASSAIKWLVSKGLEMNLCDALELEICKIINHLFTEDAKEGIAAFSEKRKPKFEGK